MGNQEKDAEQAEDVEGKDAEGTFPVKVAVVGGTLAITNEERRDEEAGEDEEDVYSRGSVLEEVSEEEDPWPPVVCVDRGGAEMMEEDDQCRDASHTVEFAKVGEGMGLGYGGSSHC